MFKQFKHWMAATLLAAVSCHAWAAPAASDDLQAAPACDLRIAAGEPGKGFSNLLRDISTVCDTEVHLCPVKTDGSFTNITLLGDNKADIGMATLDILTTMKSTDDNIAALQVALPLNLNLIHVVAKTGGTNVKTVVKGETKFGFFKADDQVTNRKDVITKFSDLKGKKVILVGSAKLTGPLLERTLGYGMKFSDAASDEEAQKAVLADQASAYITISGYPNGKLSALTSNSGLALVPYDLAPQAPYVIVKKNYTNMGVIGNPFLAVPSMILTRPYNPTGETGRKVIALQQCIIRNLSVIRENGNRWRISPQPGWGEIKNVTESYGWPYFKK